VTGQDPRIEELTAAVYEIPTDQPEADGTLAWSKTTMVIAEAVGGGHRGLGYTYVPGACQPLISGVLAGEVTGRPALDVAGSWQAMVRAVRNLGRPGLVSCPISAADTALWDLKGKLLGLPVCRLLGAVRDEVPVYGSGGFITHDSATARAQLELWAGQWAIPRVKIKIGESRGHRRARDLERIAFAREVIGPDVELYVDANGGYGRKQAVRMAGADVTWLEEPVSSDDLDGLREVRNQVAADVAAGEYTGTTCATSSGGITEWLRAAAVAAAHGLQVSGHCAPNLHAQVAAAVPNLRHLEYFHDHVRIEGRLLDGALDPSGGVLRPDQGRPGLGLELKAVDAEPVPDRLMTREGTPDTGVGSHPRAASALARSAGAAATG